MAMDPVQVLRQGSQSADVQKLQRLLNIRLAPSPKLTVDGIFGPRTLQAVLQYQAALSISADGVVGKQTWYHLLRGDKAASLQPPKPGSPSTSTPAQVAIAPASQLAKLAPPTSAVESIWEWPLEKKLLVVLQRVPSRLPGRAREEFKALLQLENLALSLAIIAGFCLLSGGTALILGIVILGFDMTMSLASAVQTAALAATEDELNEAADELAHVVLAVGVAGFIKGVGKIAKGVRGGGKGGAVEAPPKPFEEPQAAGPKSSSRAQPEEPLSKPQANAPVKFGKRGFFREEGAQPPTEQLRQEMKAAKSRADLPSPEKAGWPTIPSKEAATFKNPPEAVDLPEGTKLYRVIDSESNANGSYWITTDPRTMSEAQWRSGAAVTGEFNGDGAFVEYEVPKGGMKVWSGEAAPQMSSAGENMLAGGGTQIWIPKNSIRASSPMSTGYLR